MNLQSIDWQHTYVRECPNHSQTVSLNYCHVRFNQPWRLTHILNSQSDYSPGQPYPRRSPFWTAAGSLLVAICVSLQSFPACSEWATPPHRHHSERRSESTATQSPTSSLCALPSINTNEQKLKQILKTYFLSLQHTLVFCFVNNLSQMSPYFYKQKYLFDQVQGKFTFPLFELSGSKGVQGIGHGSILNP